MSKCIIDDKGNKFWRENNAYHREDGPAIEFTTGSNYWFYKGLYIDCYSHEEFLKIIKLKVFW